MMKVLKPERKRRWQRWSEEENAILENMTKKRKTCYEIADALGRSWLGVSAQRRKLGIYKPLATKTLMDKLNKIKRYEKEKENAQRMG